MSQEFPNVQFLVCERKMPLLKLPIRSTLVSLEKSKILIAPGSCLTKEDYKKIPEVTDILAPNLLHCEGVKLAAEVFPNAKRWGVRKSQVYKPNFQWTDELVEENWPFQEELALIPIEGIPQVKEVVFVHKTSKSLIVTDLCFNLQQVQGLGPWIILHLFGTYKRLGVSRLFLKAVKDKKAFEASIERLMKFDFDKIIINHGDNILEDGKNLLIQAFKERGYLL